MNTINKALVRLALLPAGLYRRMGADTRLVETILVTKLVINDRTPNTLQQIQKKKSDKPTSMATLGTMFVSLLMGVLFLFAFMIGNNVNTQLTVYFSMFMVLLSSMLIADFTSVLLDVRDNMIILTRPVNDATFITARLLHIFVHLAKLVLPMCLPALIFLGYRNGILKGIWFLVIVLMLTLFCIFFINAIYLLVMRLVSPQRFQSVISYVQIGLAIFIYAGYQFVPRMMGQLSDLNYSFSTHAYSLLLPPYWFASGGSLIFQATQQYDIAGAVLCFTTPFLGIWLVVRYLAPTFIRNLGLINSGGENASGKKQQVAMQSSFPERLSRIFIPKGHQQAGFLFAWKVSGRSRDFRMKVLPAIGYLFVYVVLMLSKPLKGVGDSIEDGNGTSRFLILTILYFGAFALISALGQMKYSEKWKAGWVFFTTPVQQPGLLLAGAFKAMVIKFYLPVAIPFSLICIFLAGPSMIPNVFLGLANQLLLAALMVLFTGRELPFSHPQAGQDKSSTILRSFVVLGIAGVLSVFHYFVFSFLPAVILCCFLSGAALWLVMNSIKQTSWAVIRQAEE